MEALHLDSLHNKLHKINEEFTLDSARTIENIDLKLAPFTMYIDASFDSFDFFKDYTRLPLQVFTGFSFEDICKLRFSTTTMLDSTVEDIFENQPNFELIRKIKSSWWRWGAGKGTWNELVDVYNGICSFSLDLPSEFTIRLDYTTGHNPHGYSQYLRTYIDGVFAFMVYYRGCYVMTVGFSVMENRRLLIQQVQLKQSAGNRWLYKLSKPRMEFVIDAFARSFPGFELYVIDGHSLAQKITVSYQASLQLAVEFLKRHDESVTALYSDSYVASRREEFEATTAGIAHIESEKPRLARFYADCGPYKLGPKLQVNQLIHRMLQ